MSEDNIIDAEFEETPNEETTPEVVEEQTETTDEYQPNERIKVLIVGKGYIGETLSNFLAIDEENVEVHSINREQVNYLDRQDLLTFFVNYENEGVKFDHVVNCVGYAGEQNIDDAKDNKELAYYLNAIFPITLASVVQEMEIPSLIHIGSGCIYTGVSENENGWKEEDIPNFGLNNEESSWYSKTKHASEMALTSSFKNVYSLRIRMPFSEIPSPKGNRNLFEKLIKYTTILNEENSATYLFDLHNTIYNIVVSNEIPYGIYNVVSDGKFSPALFIEILREKGEKLKEAGLIEEVSDLDRYELVNLEQFTEKNLTKENRSVTIVDNSLVKEMINIEYANIGDKEFLSGIIDNFIENSKS